MFNASPSPFDVPTVALGNDSADLFFLKNVEQKTGERQWQSEHEEGQLSVDVFETNSELMIIATLSGTRPEDIELHLHNDFLTIRGFRQSPAPADAKYFFEECYWGRFSRTIVLPLDVRGELAQSEYKNGVLTIRMPKAQNTATIPIMVVEE